MLISIIAAVALKTKTFALLVTVHAELGAGGEPVFDLHVLGSATHQLHRPTLQ